MSRRNDDDVEYDDENLLLTDARAHTMYRSTQQRSKAPRNFTRGSSLRGKKSRR